MCPLLWFSGKTLSTGQARCSGRISVRLLTFPTPVLFGQRNVPQVNVFFRVQLGEGLGGKPLGFDGQVIVAVGQALEPEVAEGVGTNSLYIARLGSLQGAGGPDDDLFLDGVVNGAGDEFLGYIQVIYPRFCLRFRLQNLGFGDQIFELRFLAELVLPRWGRNRRNGVSSIRRRPTDGRNRCISERCSGSH